jgi:hypothetical protein
MNRISVTQYAELKTSHKKKITRQAVLGQIKRALDRGTNKLKDGSIFAKIGNTYIIELNDTLELNSLE